MMNHDMGLKAGGAHQRRRQQPSKSCSGILLVAESCKQQVEPDNIRFQLADNFEDAPGICVVVKAPRPDYVEAGKLLAWPRLFVGNDRHGMCRIILQSPHYVIAVLVEHSLAGRECAYKTNLHGPWVRSKKLCFVFSTA